MSHTRFIKCIPVSATMKSCYSGPFHLRYDRALHLRKKGDVEFAGDDKCNLTIKNYRNHCRYRRVVYTAIFGNKDKRIPSVKTIPAGWDFVCFTDNVDLHSDLWLTVYVEPKHKDMTRCAREYKLTPHVLFPDHDVSVWIDGNIYLRGDINARIPVALKKNDFVALKHWQKIYGVFTEGQRCVQLRKDDPEIIKKHLRRYADEGFHNNSEIIWTAVVARNHNNQNVKAADEMWLRELQCGSRRDQISLPYVIEKTGLNVGTMVWTPSFFTRRDHRSQREKRLCRNVTAGANK